MKNECWVFLNFFRFDSGKDECRTKIPAVIRHLSFVLLAVLLLAKHFLELLQFFTNFLGYFRLGTVAD